MTPTDPATERPDLVLRPAVPDDLPAVAEVFLRARAAAVPDMPPLVHGDDDVRAHVGRIDLDEPHRTMWVAQTPEGVSVAFAELRGDWLDDLYVDPDHQGHGVGGALLDLAKAERPDGFCLWVFESNLPARRFYQRQGLVTLDRTDGSGNEERAPDVRMAWPGRDQLAFLRRQVDAVDDELAGLLARRAALTAAIQPVKPVAGHAGRDADREAEIAARMATRAPALGEERIRRIMHEVITTSLDAGEAG